MRYLKGMFGNTAIGEREHKFGAQTVRNEAIISLTRTFIKASTELISGSLLAW